MGDQESRGDSNDPETTYSLAVAVAGTVDLRALVGTLVQDALADMQGASSLAERRAFEAESNADRRHAETQCTRARIATALEALVEQGKPRIGKCIDCLYWLNDHDGDHDNCGHCNRRSAGHASDEGSECAHWHSCGEFAPRPDAPDGLPHCWRCDDTRVVTSEDDEDAITTPCGCVKTEPGT